MFIRYYASTWKHRLLQYKPAGLFYERMFLVLVKELFYFDILLGHGESDFSL